MKASFNKKLLASLAGKPKRYTILDSQTKGLGVVIFPSGAKSFFHVRKVRGYPERRTLGAFPELSLDVARGKAADLNSRLATWKSNDYAGPSPISQERGTYTLGELIDQYVERQVKPNAKDAEKGAQAVQYLVGPYLSSWKHRPITSIRRKDVSELLAKLGRERGQSSANRTVQLLRRVYYFAEREELFTGVNPASRHKLFREKSRVRFLTAEEMPRFLAALDKERNIDLKDFVYISLFTGARMSDVLQMKWSDVDLDRATWMVPDPKNSESYQVALVPELVARLRARSHLSAQWTFPSYGKTGRRMNPKASWKAFVKRAGIPDLHIHDLRRSLGSWQAALGSSLPIIGKSLGHTSTAATAIYARLNLEAVRPAVQSATDAMLATRKKLAVVPSPRKKRKAG
jgi:integrase